MILSVSRRTDIPNYYSDWFYERIKEQFVYVKNPMNPRQVSKINLSSEVVDCIVFWSKNPRPMISRLDELSDYNFFFQFTLTGYGGIIEPNVPKELELISTFQNISKLIGSERIIWRYDPIILTDQHTIEYHIKYFKFLASRLNGYTKKVIISFLDSYPKIKRNMREFGMRVLLENEMLELVKHLAQIAKENNLLIETCAEIIDLGSYGVSKGSCIDYKYIENLIGQKLTSTKDKYQREACGCTESIDIGTYNTCYSGCKYCYANYRNAELKENNIHDPNSPLLYGRLDETDKITERKVKSLIRSSNLWDFS